MRVRRRRRRARAGGHSDLAGASLPSLGRRLATALYLLATGPAAAEQRRFVRAQSDGMASPAATAARGVFPGSVLWA